MKQIKMHMHIGISVFLILLTFLSCFEIFYIGDAVSSSVSMRMFIYIIYTAVLLILYGVYGAWSFGKSSISNLVYSQALSELIAIAFIYIVSIAAAHSIINPLPLLLVVVIQLLINCMFSIFGNRLYYRLHRPKKALVIYREESDLLRLGEIKKLPQKFEMEKYIKDPASIFDLLPEFKNYEVIFVVGVEATLRNGIAKYCIENNVVGYIYPHVGDVIMMGAEHERMFAVPLVEIRRSSPNFEYLFFKRTFDIFVSLIGIILSSPFMLITAVAIKLYDRGPVIYSQVRLTKDGKKFRILKFRSMKTDAEKDGVARLASDGDSRITPVGRIIRACRLDELPQLFNILKGDSGIIETTKKNIDFSRVVTVNSIPL